MDSSSLISASAALNAFITIVAAFVTISFTAFGFLYKGFEKLDDECRNLAKRIISELKPVTDLVIRRLRDGLESEEAAEIFLYSISKKINELNEFVHSYRHGFGIKGKLLASAAFIILWVVFIGSIIFFVGKSGSGWDLAVFVRDILLWLFYAIPSVGVMWLYWHRELEKYRHYIDDLEDSLSDVKTAVGSEKANPGRILKRHP